MVDITVESEVWGHGALAAEGRLEKSSFKLRSEDTDRFWLRNEIRQAIPDLRASGAEATWREDRFGAWYTINSVIRAIFWALHCSHKSWQKEARGSHLSRASIGAQVSREWHWMIARCRQRCSLGLDLETCSWNVWVSSRKFWEERLVSVSSRISSQTSRSRTWRSCYSEHYAKFFKDIHKFHTTSSVAYSLTWNIYLFRIGCSILM